MYNSEKNSAAQQLWVLSVSSMFSLSMMLTSRVTTDPGNYYNASVTLVSYKQGALPPCVQLPPWGSQACCAPSWTGGREAWLSLALVGAKQALSRR